MTTIGRGAVTVWIGILAGITGMAGGQVTNNWTAASGSWTNGANWSEGHPVPGQHVAVTAAGANVLLTEPTPDLASFTLSRTLTFTNWNSILTATNILIQSGATVTLPAAFTDSIPSNNIYFACVNFSLLAGATIQADNRGYRGDIYTVQIAGYGPGRGSASRMGGGHGGAGGTQYTPAVGGMTNALVDAPVNPGSGGAREVLGTDATVPGAGAGGGAIRIAATGTVLINGTVTANGQSANGYSGNAGGSGGSIFIFVSRVPRRGEEDGKEGNC